MTYYNVSRKLARFGDWLRLRGHPTQGSPFVQAAVSLCPRWYYPQFCLGYLMVDLQDTIAAIAAFQSVAESDAPQDIRMDALVMLGNIHCSGRDNIKAAAMFDWALSTASLGGCGEVSQEDIVSATCGLGLLAERAGDIERAIELYKSCLSSGVRPPTPCVYLAAVYADRGHIAEAIQLYTEALRGVAEAYEAAHGLAWCHLRRDEVDEARRFFRMAVRLGRRPHPGVPRSF